MVKSKIKKRKAKKSLGVLIVSIIFLILSISLIIIGFYSNIVSWLSKFGTVLLAIALPMVLYIGFKIIRDKIEEI